MVSLAASFFVACLARFFPIILPVNAPLRVLTSLIDSLSGPSSGDLQICPRAVSDRTSHTRSDRTDCQTHRLGLNLPTNDSADVSVPLLLQSYREKYPADPVTEQDFGKLINELRPNNRGSTPTTKSTPTQPRCRPVAKQVSPMNNNDEHETINERDGSLEPHTTGIFTEFVKCWRELRSNGAMSNDADAAGGRPRRKLDVLSWGFGE